MAADMLIDANVFMYAAGGEHRYRGPCRTIVRMLGNQPALDGRTACVDTELFQEVAYRYASIGRPSTGREMQRAIRALGLRLLSVDAPVVDRFVELQETHGDALEQRRVSVRDLLHLAVMRAAGIDHILSADRDFELLAVQRVDPVAFVKRLRRRPRTG